MPRVLANGVHLYYEWFGPSSYDTIVLQNGVFMSTASWGLQIHTLAKRYRVLTYDMRGQGRSEHPDGEYSMTQHAADFVALMDALGIDRAHMVGTSYGGELNLILGLLHPERCRTLTAIASASHSELPLKEIITRWIAAAETGDAAHFFTVIHPDVYSGTFRSAHPELLGQIAQRAAGFDLAAAVRLMRSFAAFDVSGELSRIALPTCLVSAADDALKPPHYGEFLHKHIARSDYHVIDDAGHAVVLERPDEVTDIVLDFLSRQPRSPFSDAASA